MKKVLKIIGIIVLVLVVLIAAFLIYLSKKPAVSDDYIAWANNQKVTCYTFVTFF